MLLDISSFWQGLTLIQKIYWIVAIPSTVLFILQLILTFIGFDHDTDVATTGDADMSVDADHGIGSQFLSFKNLLAFFTVFAWSGLACIESKMSISVAVVISVFCGFLMVVIMATIFYYMTKLSESGTLNINNAVNKIGTVYLTIPTKRSGLGKVQIKLQGYQTLDAMTNDETELKTGSVVKVIEVINNEILLVTRE